MPEPGYEHNELKGITIRNMLVTVICTASIVASVVATYFGLRGDMQDIRADQREYREVTDLKLKHLEQRQDIMQQQIEALQKYK